MPQKDFYEILGVSKNASEEEIKRAYRRLAQKHHPDRTKGDKASEEKFKEINQAYEVLGDNKRRQQYDQFGRAGFAGGFPGAGSPPPGFDFGSFSGFGEGFADIFETFFGGAAEGFARKKRRSSRGEDLEIMLDLTFEEAVFGVEKEIRVNRIEDCEACKGSGAEPSAKIIPCPSCRGTGEIRMTKSTILGAVTTSRICDSCEGEGRIPEKKCGACKGKGRKRAASKIKVKIPAGVDHGSVVRLSDKGNAGLKGAPHGDLFVNLNVLPSKKWRRKDADIYSDSHIHLVQAVLGDIVPVETLHGEVKLKIPAGTRSEKFFKLKNYGVPFLKSDFRGDHYVRIIIDIPQKLTSREKELYKGLAKEAGLDLQSADKGFFGKLFE